MAPYSIPPGSDYASEITPAISQSKVMAVYGNGFDRIKVNSKKVKKEHIIPENNNADNKSDIQS